LEPLRAIAGSLAGGTLVRRDTRCPRGRGPALLRDLVVQTLEGRVEVGLELLEATLRRGRLLGQVVPVPEEPPQGIQEPSPASWSP
jgi:hypothetical protein